ncbi:MAG: ferrochelatase [Pseudomonadota bacterium]
MARYSGDADFDHGKPQTIGLLVVNLGTPDDPSTGAVRRYLKQFLWDPRVVEQPRWLWWLILNLIILRIRPSRSAAAYQKIWTDKGSPLLLYSQSIADKVGAALAEATGSPVVTELGMSYGSPSIPDAIERLRAKNARRLVVLPLYPQYSATTTATVFDQVTETLRRQRWVPELRFINQYHDRPRFITALADSVRAHWQEHGRGERLLFSFHGIPQRYFRAGDPYHCQCQKTARLVADALGLEKGSWQVSFQSRVGREPWLMPYTDYTLEDWGAEKLGNVDVICPGFAADCLETLEEIALENGEAFVEAGGGALRYIPSLNDGDDQVATLSDLVLEQTAGWHDALKTDNAQIGDSARRAEALEQHAAAS